MKYRNNFKHALPMVLLLCLLIGMGACVKEDFIGGAGTENYSSVSIKVKMPEPTVTNPMSRAVAKEFDEVKDMNIIISNGLSIKTRLFLDFVNMKASCDGETETKIINNSEIATGVKISYKDEDGFRLFNLFFSEQYWEKHSDILLKTCSFYAVANWGKAITGAEDYNSVTELKKFKVLGTVNDGYCSVTTPNIMFGEISEESTKVIDANKPGEVTREVKIEVERTAAMISLVMDGSNLNPGVVINLTDVTLHNVPTYCTLGPNRFTTDSDKLAPEGAISSLGEFKGGGVVSGGYRLTGTATLSLPNFGEDQGYRTSIGTHEVNTASAQPFFIYENIHGEDFGAPETEGQQQYKRPNGVGSTLEEIKAAASNVNLACSYIEVKAEYFRYKYDPEDAEAYPELEEKGTAAWRFFLGGDAFRDFDVKRNTHYKLTLTLRGAGANEASWRVDKDTKTNTVVGDEKMVVGGGGEAFCVELAGNLSEVIKNGLKLDGEGADFVYVRTIPNKNTPQWTRVQGLTGNTEWQTIDDKQMWFYVQPLLPDDSYDGNERHAVVNFKPNKGSANPVATVEFTQYRPVTFSITADDLSKYPDDADLLAAKKLIEDVYKHDFSAGNEFKFYADRVDRGPIQWGFSNVQLDKNQKTGFENVYHLIDPLPENETATCEEHIEHAKIYLPTGKGTKELDKNGKMHIDYSRGSCMMHAAMENVYQQYYPYPGCTENGYNVPDLTLQNLVEMDLPARPQKTNGSNDTHTYSWCVPSIVGWQLLEKLDRFYKRHGIAGRGFDPKYPIVKWSSYWTSNATTKDLGDPSSKNYVKEYEDLKIDGKNRSFVYQFDMGLDKVKEGEIYPAHLILPRTSMLKYRLINIKPENLK